MALWCLHVHVAILLLVHMESLAGFISKRGGEGYDAETQLPIDIPDTKVLEWVLDRNVVKRGWFKQLTNVRELINTALEDLPDVRELTDLLCGKQADHAECLQILELLKKHDGKTNIFGQYTSKYVKQWNEIIRLFEADNVYLAELCHVLVQNLTFEIPACRRTIDKCQAQAVDLRRKEVECKRNMHTYRKKYQEACTELGINGEDVRAELPELLHELPDIYGDIATRVKAELVGRACDYYRGFVCYVLGKETVSVVPALSLLRDRGNVVATELRPIAVEMVGEITMETTDTGEDETDVHVNWGETTEELAPPENPDGGINWDVGEVVDDSGIDWNGFTVEAVGESAEETILENPQTRGDFVNDLVELEAFFKQRISEMTSENGAMVNTYRTAESIVQQVGVETIRTFLDVVQDIHARIQAPRVQHLIMIKHSKKYLDRLARSLEQKLEFAQRIDSTLTDLAKREKEIQETIEATCVQQRELIARCKEVKAPIEAAISKHFHGRVIHLLGEINSFV